jgi:hypothetical protein
MTSIRLIVILSVAMLLLSGCFSSSVRYYSLQDGQTPMRVSDKPSEVLRVGVSLVGLPKLLNRPQLVVRVSNSEVSFAELHQWGGRLQEEVTQLLVSELQALHLQQAVYVYPADNRVIPNQQWSAELIQLDGTLGGKVRLQATCRLLDKSSRIPVYERSVQREVQAQGDQVSDYVDAQRMLLKQLATECAW